MTTILVTIAISGLYVEQSRNNVMPEAIDSWQKWSLSLLMIEGKLAETTHTAKTRQTGEPKSIVRFFKRMNDCFLVEEAGLRRTLEDGTTWIGRSVRARGQNYSFGLSSKSEDGPWVVTSHYANVSDDRQSYRIGVERLLHMPFMLFSVNLSDIIRDTHFKIVATTRNSNGSVQIEFSRADTPDLHIVGGWFEIDPKLSYGVTRFEFKQPEPHPGTITGSVEYDGEFEGFPKAKRVVVHLSSLDVRHEFDLLELRKRVIPVDEFKLTAYGFPEALEPIESGSWPMWLWWLGIAVVCFAMALAFRRRLRTA